MSKKFACIILAAGKGTRMKSDIPKVLHRLYYVWGHKKPIHLEVVETFYPPKAPWYDVWRPDGSRKPAGRAPSLKIVRWTIAGGTFECRDIDYANAHPVTREIIDNLVSKKK